MTLHPHCDCSDCDTHNAIVGGLKTELAQARERLLRTYAYICGLAAATHDTPAAFEISESVTNWVQEEQQRYLAMRRTELRTETDQAAKLVRDCNKTIKKIEHLGGVPGDALLAQRAEAVSLLRLLGTTSDEAMLPT